MQRGFFIIYIAKLSLSYTSYLFLPTAPTFFFNFSLSFTPPVFMSLLYSFDSCFLFATISRYYRGCSIGVGSPLQKGGKIGQAGENCEYGAEKLLITEICPVFTAYLGTHYLFCESNS